MTYLFKEFLDKISLAGSDEPVNPVFVQELLKDIPDDMSNEMIARSDHELFMEDMIHHRDYDAYGFGNLMFKLHDAGIFTVPTWKWVRDFIAILNPEDKVLDFAAGACVVTAMLRNLGVKVDAVDNGERKMRPMIQDRINMDGIEYLKRHADEYTVMFCGWPEYQKPVWKEACDVFFENPDGKRAYYIGEGEYGCTADDSFFQTYINRPIKSVRYRSLPGLNDAFNEVIRRRSNNESRSA